MLNAVSSIQPVDRRRPPCCYRCRSVTNSIPQPSVPATRIVCRREIGAFDWNNLGQGLCNRPICSPIVIPEIYVRRCFRPPCTSWRNRGPHPWGGIRNGALSTVEGVHRRPDGPYGGIRGSSWRARLFSSTTAERKAARWHGSMARTGNTVVPGTGMGLGRVTSNRRGGRSTSNAVILYSHIKFMI